MTQSSFVAVAGTHLSSTRLVRAALAASSFAAVLLLGAAAHAEGPAPETHAPARVHEGFYLRMGGGPSFVTLRGHGPAGSASLTALGSGGFLKIGGALAPGFVLAGTLEGVSFDSEFRGGPFTSATVNAGGKTSSASHDARGETGMVGVLVDWYPRPTGGWHAGVASGVGVIALRNMADGSDYGGVNFAGSAFGGYDWKLGRDWAIGLQLTASSGTTTKMMDSDRHDTGYRLTPLSVGLQASVLYF